jgi:glutamyl-tRNA synthetase
VRIKVPDDIEQVSFNDLIRGPITFDKDQLDDFIIARSDGVPTYNFVVVVDDALMNISHVIRGEDHISNTPKQILLYQALGYALPLFAHLPLILGPTGARLSKRDAATAVSDYRKSGYLADALCNYLVRLGWSHGDQEVFSRQEMINYFSLDEIGKKGAIFDGDKLNWLNGIYIRDADARQLLEFIKNDVEPEIVKKLAPWSEQFITQAIKLYQERVKTLRELVEELLILHAGPIEIDPEEKTKWITADSMAYLKDFLNSCKDVQLFEANLLSSIAKQIAQTAGVKIVSIAQPLRIALLGKSSGPSVFELLVLLGKQESTARIEHLIASL